MSNPGEGSRPKYLARITLRKFEGEKLVETVVLRDEDFTDHHARQADESVAELEAKAKQEGEGNAAD